MNANTEAAGPWATGSWAAGSWAARTDVGAVRDHNEDTWAGVDGAWVVADGLGGHAGGEIASAAGAQAALAVLQARDSSARPDEVLGRAFAAAHEAVRQAGRGQRVGRSMGTTLVAALSDPAGRMHIGSVGDSRAYALTADGLRRVTRDDNYAEDLLAAGVITAAEARTHPGQFQLTRALIADDEAQAPQVVSVTGPARLLLCSDGLNAELEDEQIESLLGAGAVEKATTSLVAAAVAAGGSDNVTVIVIDVAAAS